MKALLEAIKVNLVQDSNLSIIGDKDIFITDHEDSPPPGCMLPAIGIMCGAARNKQEIGNRYIQEVEIEITAYQRQNLPEESTTGTSGVQEIASKIKTSLINNRLGFTTGNGQIINAFPLTEESSKEIEINGVKSTRKKIIFLYARNMNW